MRKLLYILALIFAHVGYAQVYEAGVSYNAGSIFGEDKSSGSLFGSNFGIIIKKNMNPRLSYRIAATNINSNGTKLTELSAGIDFNFNKFNLVRANGLNKGTPYIIFELASIFYDNGVDSNKFAMVLPMGVGYKKSITRSITGSIEAKGRVAFTDKLDSGITNSADVNYVKQNKTTFDAYYYIGVTLHYTFGWPRGSQNQIRF